MIDINIHTVYAVNIGVHTTNTTKTIHSIWGKIKTKLG